MWAQQDLRRVLGVAGARVVCRDLPVRACAGRLRRVRALRARSSPSGSRTAPRASSCRRGAHASRLSPPEPGLRVGRSVAEMRPRSGRLQGSRATGDPALAGFRSAPETKPEGPRLRGPSRRIPALDLVEALPARASRKRRRTARSREPPTLARRFPVVPGTRLYPLVPPLPVLSSLKPDHLLSAVAPAYALRADGGRAEPCSARGPRTTDSSSPRSSATVTLESDGSA